MKIGATKDFKRPRGKVFASFADPERMDAVLGGLGANLRREGQGGAGTRWQLEVTAGTKPRPVTVTLMEQTVPDSMKLHATSDKLDGQVTFTFADLPTGGCQVSAEINLKPRSLTAHVAIQALRLAKGKIRNRMGRALAVLGKPG